jgi:hypothetical protein
MSNESGGFWGSDSADVGTEEHINSKSESGDLLCDTSNWDDSCDNCEYQCEGRHYCNLHGITVTNMDVKCCEDFESKRRPNP